MLAHHGKIVEDLRVYAFVCFLVFFPIQIEKVISLLCYHSVFYAIYFVFYVIKVVVWRPSYNVYCVRRIICMAVAVRPVDGRRTRGIGT